MDPSSSSSPLISGQQQQPSTPSHSSQSEGGATTTANDGVIHSSLSHGRHNSDKNSTQFVTTETTLRRRSSNSAALRRFSTSSAASVLPPHEPWAGWSTVLKVLYAIVVPAIIIYLLARIEPRARTVTTTSEYYAHTPFSPKEHSQSHLSPHGGRATEPSSTSSRVTSMATIQYTSFDEFMLFGDSITQYSFNVDLRGFGAQLAHKYLRRLDVINRGFSGYTTDQAIHLLPQFLPRGQKVEDKTQPKIQFLTIFFGANDSCLSFSPQHVPIERYERNLRALIDMVHSPSSPYYAPWTKIIVIVPPVIDYDRWAQHRDSQGRPMDRTVDQTREYAIKCREVAQEYQAKNKPKEDGQPWYHQVDVIDTWNLMNDQIRAGNKSLGDYLVDGLHLNSDGNELIYQELSKLIQTKYSDWDPETMPMHGPWWGNLSKEHPETDLLVCANKP
ncbi:hypothetical protein BGW42_003775 [Actinomortierella wolfii]|nr:hypothetical protein BGW42_003775 [Actinomortierella wolfii]